MIQRKHSDFFERLTQEIAEFFAALIGKKLEDVEEELNLAYNKWLKLDRKSLDEIAPEWLSSTLLEEMNLDVNQLEILADVFAREGELYFKEKQFIRSKLKLKNAAMLFEFVDQEKQIFSFERQAIVQNIKALINHIESHYKNDNI